MSKRLSTQLREIVDLSICLPGIEEKYKKRISEGNLTMEENPQSHFVVAFAAYDPSRKTVFVGHHRKSGLWLFSGGHIDKGELPLDTVRREFEEEWGKQFVFDNVRVPSLLTFTQIDNPGKQKCREHYDIWYFIPIDSETFFPDKNTLAQEFLEADWKAFPQARELITTPSYLEPIDKIEEILSK